MKLLGILDIGKKAECANCGRPTTQWVSLGNATAPTCDRCKREVEAAIKATKGFDDQGRNFGPHE